MAEAPSNGHLQVAGMALPIRESAYAAMRGLGIEPLNARSCLLVDGLGHGREAAEAAQEAVATFRKRM